MKKTPQQQAEELAYKWALRIMDNNFPDSTEDGIVSIITSNSTLLDLIQAKEELDQLNAALEQIFDLRPINGMTVVESLRKIIKERDQLKQQLAASDLQRSKLFNKAHGLEHDLHTSNARNADLKEQLDLQDNTISQLQSTNSELVKDKERYEFLKSNSEPEWIYEDKGNPDQPIPVLRLNFDKFNFDFDKLTDEIIDSAMKGSK